MLPLLGQAGFSEWNPMASFPDVFFMGPCSLASWSKQVQLLQTHVGTCDIRQIATSHMLLKVCERHFDHFEKLKLVRSGFLYFHARTGHEVIGAPRRIPTVPARSRPLHRWEAQTSCGKCGGNWRKCSSLSVFAMVGFSRASPHFCSDYIIYPKLSSRFVTGHRSALSHTRCATRGCNQASDENVLGSGLDRWMSI